MWRIAGIDEFVEPIHEPESQSGKNDVPSSSLDLDCVDVEDEHQAETPSTIGRSLDLGESARLAE